MEEVAKVFSFITLLAFILVLLGHVSFDLYKTVHEYQQKEQCSGT